MLGLCRRYATGVIVVGVTALLVGLAWDAVLHGLDPDLAAREGVFAPGNPGHVLFGLGIVLTAAGAVMLLLGRLSEPRAGRTVLLSLAGSLGIIVLAGASLGLAVTSGNLGSSVLHVHEDGAVHTHTQHQAFEAMRTRADGSATATNGSGGHDHAMAPAVTYEQLAFATRLVEQVRENVRRYEDVRVAEAEGYRMVTAGALLHYVHYGYIGDGRLLDPERIESLVYFRVPGQAPKLVGAMFLTRPGEKGPEFGGPLTAWHIHDNLCYNVRTGVITALTNSRGECPAGTEYRGVTGEMLHVWVVDTPAGVFAEMNQVLPYLLQLTLGSR